MGPSRVLKSNILVLHMAFLSVLTLAQTTLSGIPQFFEADLLANNALVWFWDFSISDVGGYRKKENNQNL